MRITGGSLAGRRVKVPGQGVRPTTDRVREAIFSILAPILANLRVLDLFAGSGVVGLEAWSRGAAHVCWMEADRRTLALLRENLATMDITHPHIVSGRVETALKRSLNPAPYDVVFADAPYGWEAARLARNGCAHPTIPALIQSSGCLTPSGLLIVERAVEDGALPCPGWEATDHRIYGGSGLTFYRKDTRR